MSAALIAPAGTGKTVALRMLLANLGILSSLVDGG